MAQLFAGPHTVKTCNEGEWHCRTMQISEGRRETLDHVWGCLSQKKFRSVLYVCGHGWELNTVG